jgi:hypothetical protein
MRRLVVVAMAALTATSCTRYECVRSETQRRPAFIQMIPAGRGQLVPIYHPAADVEVCLEWREVKR